MLGNASFLNEFVQLGQCLRVETKIGDMCSSRHDGTMSLLLPKRRHLEECLLALAQSERQQWLTLYAQVCNDYALARGKVGLNSMSMRVCAHARPMLQQLTVLLQHQHVTMLARCAGSHILFLDVLELFS